MLPLLRRLASLTGTILGSAASLSFASAQVWAQPSPSAARGVSGEAIPPAATAPVIDGKIRNMVITGAKGDTIEVTYANTGTVVTTIAGEVQLFVSEDEVVATVAFADGQIIKPGATQRFRVAMPKLPKGRYTLIALVEYGGDAMTAAHAKLDMR